MYSQPGKMCIRDSYWDVLVKDKDGHKVSSDEYKAMSKEEKKGMDVIPFFKAFPVYNIDQTNLCLLYTSLHLE